MPDPVPNLDFELLEADEGGVYYPKLKAWLQSHKDLINLFNALQETGADVGSILGQIQDEIATFENYLDNYNGVASVNGQSGTVTLDAQAVGALPAAATAENALRLGAIVAANFYHTANKPSKADVGLSKVTNDTSFAELINSANANINRAAKITDVVYWDAADVTYTIVSAGFAIGDKIYVTLCYDTTGKITLVADFGTITLMKTGDSAASQTLEAAGTVCLIRISNSTFLVRNT